MNGSRREIERELHTVDNEIACRQAELRSREYELLSRAQGLMLAIAEQGAITRRPLPERSETHRSWCLRRMRADKRLLDYIVAFPGIAPVGKQRVIVDTVCRIERLVEDEASEEEFAALEVSICRQRERVRT